MYKQLMMGLCAGVCMHGAMADYSQIIVFGDSMSDTHRFYNLSKFLLGTGYPKPPSVDGRFSNGPVAVEYLADSMKLPLVNYSFAGATTGYSSLVIAPEGVLTQINEYLNSKGLIPTVSTLPLISNVLSKVPGTGKADPKALYILWSGPDDFYTTGRMNTSTSITATANMKQAVDTLYTNGARYFFIPLMPDLSLTPSARYHETAQSGYIASARTVTDDFHVKLSQAIAQMRAQYPLAHIMSFDSLTGMRNKLTELQAQGINTTEPCVTGGFDYLNFKNPPLKACPDPEHYFFWDGNHPTTWVNKGVAEAWLPALTERP